MLTIHLFGSKGPNEHVPFETRIQWRDYSVVASVFWYPGMPGYKYTVQYGWDQKRANTTWRSYNYVHPSAIYYSLYRIARDNVQYKYYKSMVMVFDASISNICSYATSLLLTIAQFGLMVSISISYVFSMLYKLKVIHR